LRWILSWRSAVDIFAIVDVDHDQDTRDGAVERAEIAEAEAPGCRFRSAQFLHVGIRGSASDERLESLPALAERRSQR
jgi:hypothetical protein